MLGMQLARELGINATGGSSTVADAWEPLRAEDLYNPGVYLGMKLNPHQRVAIFVTRAEEQARWTSAR